MNEAARSLTAQTLQAVRELWKELGPWVVVLFMLYFLFDARGDLAALLTQQGQEQLELMTQFVVAIETQTRAVQAQTVAIESLCE